MCSEVPQAAANLAAERLQLSGRGRKGIYQQSDFCKRILVLVPTVLATPRGGSDTWTDCSCAVVLSELQSAGHRCLPVSPSPSAACISVAVYLPAMNTMYREEHKHPVSQGKHATCCLFWEDPSRLIPCKMPSIAPWGSDAAQCRAGHLQIQRAQEKAQQ